jgi:hypothetical protein
LSYESDWAHTKWTVSEQPIYYIMTCPPYPPTTTDSSLACVEMKPGLSSQVIQPRDLCYFHRQGSTGSSSNYRAGKMKVWIRPQSRARKTRVIHLLQSSKHCKPTQTMQFETASSLSCVSSACNECDYSGIHSDEVVQSLSFRLGNER